VTFKLGIVGCGRVVEEGHVPALLALAQQATVVALADPGAARRTAVRELLGSDEIVEHDDWRDLLASGDVDAVVIGLPHHLHVRAISDAASAGVDVICEKPLVNTLAEADAVERALAASDVRLAVMHNWAFNADQQAAIDAIAAGRIGEPFLVRNEMVWGVPYAGRDPSGDWRLHAAQAGGGIVITNAYHQAYLAELEMGSPVVRVHASFGGPEAADEVESTAVITFEHRNGGTTAIQRSWASVGGGVGVHEIHGAAGSIRFHQADPAALNRMFRGEAALPATGEQRPTVELYERARDAWAALAVPSRPWWEGMRVLYERTFEAWRRDEPAPVGIEQARRVLQIVQAIYDSARRGTSVEVAELASSGGSG
jgi:predicted dehydrogenase